MRTSYPSLLEVAVLAYCIWQAADLPKSWLSAPAERYAWIAFLIWCLPVLWHTLKSIQSKQPKGFAPLYLGAAIALALVGSLGSLNILRHIALACAIAGMIPMQLWGGVWVLAALSWLPGLGWMIKSLPFHLIPFVQIGLASVGSAIMILSLRRS